MDDFISASKLVHITAIALVAVLIFFVLIIMMTVARAEDYSDTQILWAIFKAEGGYNATYLFGIRSIPYKDFDDAKQKCLNTIRNNRKRFLRQIKYTDFLEFLGSRYCPVSTHKLNQYWLKNVRYFLEKAQ